MQQYQFTDRFELIKEIEFKSPGIFNIGDEPLHVRNILFFKEEEVSGTFIKKEFRYSFDNVVWTSWNTLTQSNLANIEFRDRPDFYLHVKYTRNAIGSGNIARWYLYYEGLYPTPPVPPSDVSIDADTLMGEGPAYYLDRENHTGPYTGLNISDVPDGSNAGVYHSRVDSSFGTTFYFKRVTGTQGIIVTDSSSGLITFRLNPDIYSNIVLDSSLGADFYWSNGYLEVSTACCDQLKIYIDGSLASRDASIDWLYNNRTVGSVTEASLGTDFYWDPSGYLGVSGSQGIQGTVGTQGLQGTQGTIGVQGVQGIQGQIGIQGVIGVQGKIGTQGTLGVQGIQGTIGSQGIQGTQGIQGKLGVQGTRGIQGTRGAQGIIGSQGLQGVQGIQGSKGIQGTVGSQGLGVQGTQGVQGKLGAQGTRGIQGREGAQGLGVQGTQGVQGKLGAQGTRGIQGIIGAQGLGVQGTQGEDGLQGIQGTRGIQGREGAQGLGVQGTQGVQGIQGLSIQGAQGKIGPQGLCIQGTQGTFGIQGAQGIPGAFSGQGVQGTEGSQGVQGTQGIGSQGVQGTQGSQGIQGIQGTIGWLNDLSVNELYSTFIRESSLGDGLAWDASGFLDVSINVSQSTILTFDASIEGDDITTSFPIIHNLNTMRQNIEIWDYTTNEVLYPAITKGLTTDYISFYTPPATGTIYNINIIGF